MSDSFIYWLALSVLFDIGALLKPFGMRLVLGLFFIAMAVGVNIGIVLFDPGAIVGVGENSVVPLYRWVFQHWVAAEPLAFLLPLIVFEVVVGVMILSSGRTVRYGLVAAAVFLVAIAPLHEATVPNIVLAVGALLLLRHNHEASLFDIIAGKHKHPPTSLPTSA